MNENVIGKATWRLLAFTAAVLLVLLIGRSWEVQGYDPLGDSVGGLFDAAHEIRTALDVHDAVLLERSREMDGFED